MVPAVKEVLTVSYGGREREGDICCKGRWAPRSCSSSETRLVLQYSGWWKSSAVWMLEDYKLISPRVLQPTLTTDTFKCTPSIEQTAHCMSAPTLPHAALLSTHSHGHQRGNSVHLNCLFFFLCEGEFIIKKNLNFYYLGKQVSMNSHTFATNHPTFPTISFLQPDFQKS